MTKDEYKNSNRISHNGIFNPGVGNIRKLNRSEINWLPIIAIIISAIDTATGEAKLVIDKKKI